MGELALRFVIGGLVVSLFSLLGEFVKPKTFSGLFAAAPSVAIGSLALTLAHQGPRAAETNTQCMLAGTAGMVAYVVACLFTLRRQLGVVAATTIPWAVWGLVAGSVLLVVRYSGAVQ
jgi:hypothetical protein